MPFIGIRMVEKTQRELDPQDPAHCLILVAAPAEEGNQRQGDRFLKPLHTVRAGRPYGRPYPQPFAFP